MKDLKVVFMGTPDFSVPILKNLINNTNVIGVVTAPDAFVGRKKVLTPCPVKCLALENNIEVFSPEKIKLEYDFLIKLNPDIIITCAYGQIIPKEVLNIPRLGCINLHGSILPKYRGGAPIHYAIINGENETGITLMYMDEKMDAGDIIKIEKIPITKEDNIDTLSDKLSILASNMIIDNLPSIINGTNERIKQDEKLVTFAPIIKREDEHIDFSKTTNEVYNKIRALTPHPYANFILDNIECKIVECEMCDAKGEVSTICFEDKISIIIKTSDGGIKITKLKPMGKNIMSIKDFKNGYHDTLLGKIIK